MGNICETSRDPRGPKRAADAGQRKGGAAAAVFPPLLLPLLCRELAPALAHAAGAHPPWFPGASVSGRLPRGEDRHGGIWPAGSLGLVFFQLCFFPAQFFSSSVVLAIWGLFFSSSVFFWLLGFSFFQLICFGSLGLVFLQLSFFLAIRR